MTTVAELIEQLKTMPQDSVVVSAFDDGAICDIDAQKVSPMHRMSKFTYYPCYDNCHLCASYPEYPLVSVVTL